MKNILHKFSAEQWGYWMEDVLNGGTVAYPISRWSSDEEPGETITKMVRFLQENQISTHLFETAVENLLINLLGKPHYNIAKIDALLGAIIYTKSPRFKPLLTELLLQGNLHGLHYRSYTLEAILLQALTALTLDTNEYNILHEKVRSTLEKGLYDPSFYGKALEFAYRAGKNNKTATDRFFNYLTVICRKAKGRQGDEKQFFLDCIFRELLRAIHYDRKNFYKGLYEWLCGEEQRPHSNRIIKILLRRIQQHFMKNEAPVDSDNADLYAKVLYLNLISRFPPHKDWIDFFRQLPPHAPRFLLKNYLTEGTFVDSQKYIKIYCFDSVFINVWYFIWEEDELSIKINVSNTVVQNFILECCEKSLDYPTTTTPGSKMDALLQLF